MGRLESGLCPASLLWATLWNISSCSPPPGPESSCAAIFEQPLPQPLHLEWLLSACPPKCRPAVPPHVLRALSHRLSSQTMAESGVKATLRLLLSQCILSPLRFLSLLALLCSLPLSVC